MASWIANVSLQFLWVKNHIAKTHSIGDELSSSAGNSALLDNNGALTSILSNNTSDSLKSGHISGAASTNSTVLGRGIDGDKDDIGLANAGSNISAEEEVSHTLGNLGLALITGGGFASGSRLVGEGGFSGAVTSDTDDVVQTGLVDGRMLRVPSSNSGLVSVNDCNLDVGVLECNDGSRGTT